MHVQVLWCLPARFCKEILTDNIPLKVASRKVGFVFSKWLQGLVVTGHTIDLNMKPAAVTPETEQVPSSPRYASLVARLLFAVVLLLIVLE